MKMNEWREWGDERSAYMNYQYIARDATELSGKLSLVIADMNNWLKDEGWSSHFDPEFVRDVLCGAPDALNRVLTNNFHLTRTIDKERTEFEEEMDRLHQMYQAQIDVLETQLSTAQILLRGEKPDE